MGTAERLLGVAAFIAGTACGGLTEGNPRGASSGGQTGVGAEAGTGGTAGATDGIVPCDAVKSLPVCTFETTFGALHTVNLLILLDKSGSMRTTPAGYTAISKWDAMKNALGAVLSEAPSAISVGLDLFPKVDVPTDCAADACCAMPDLVAPLTVPVAPARESVPAILGALGAITPGGGTPAAAALRRAFDYYTAGEGRTLVGDKYVLLATDGGPNCGSAAPPSCGGTNCTPDLAADRNCDLDTNCCSAAAQAFGCLDDQEVTTQIQNLREAGVITIVLGVPGSDPYGAYLSAFAQAGWSAQYYAAAEHQGVINLGDTLQMIPGTRLKSCVITFTKPPAEPDLVTVLVDCVVIPKNPVDGGDGSSWVLDLAQNTITLQGAICDRITGEGALRIDYVVGCQLP